MILTECSILNQVQKDAKRLRAPSFSGKLIQWQMVIMIIPTSNCCLLGRLQHIRIGDLKSTIGGLLASDDD